MELVRNTSLMVVPAASLDPVYVRPVQEETEDSRDTHSIAYLYECLEKLAEEINEGRIERKHIKDVLKDECGVVFGD